MNNKEFIAQLAEQNGMTPHEAQRLVEHVVAIMADHLDDGNTIAIQGFGNYEAKKKAERIIINPNTKQRQLIPPKLAISFKPSNVLKDSVISTKEKQ